MKRKRKSSKRKRANRGHLSPLILSYSDTSTRARTLAAGTHERARTTVAATATSSPPPPPPPSPPHVTTRRTSPWRKQRVGTYGRRMNGTEGAERGTRNPWERKRLGENHSDLRWRFRIHDSPYLTWSSPSSSQSAYTIEGVGRYKTFSGHFVLVPSVSVSHH